ADDDVLEHAHRQATRTSSCRPSLASTITRTFPSRAQNATREGGRSLVRGRPRGSDPGCGVARRRAPSTFFGRVFPLRQRRPQVVAVVGGGAGSSAGLLAVPLVMSSAALLLLRALRGGRFVAAPHPGQPVPAGHEQATRRAGQ